MKIGTRLLLPLLLAVVAVMGLFAAWAIQQRQETLATETHAEVRAYAIALGIAFESALRDPARGDIQAIIDRISGQPSVYGIRVYDREGNALFTSAAMEAAALDRSRRLERVLSGGERVERSAVLAGEPVYAVVQPIRDAETQEVVGALEVLQPIGQLTAEQSRIRSRFLLNTAVLIAALSVLILWMIRRLVAVPLQQMAGAAAAVGGGDLSYRVPTAGARGELAQLASEFNRMAEQLQEAQSQIVQEAEERLGLERRVRESEKLAAIGNLAGGLAHQIAAPLHVIQGRAELLQKGLKDGGSRHDRERHLGIIVSEIRRITAIVRNLLDFARRREPRLGDADIIESIREVASFLEPELVRTGTRFELNATRPVMARADPAMLHQVLLNLIVNAIQAMEDSDGERVLRVTAEQREEDGEVLIELSDTGAGVPPGNEDRIFEPLFSTKAPGSGTGFGLAVARTMAEEQGGQLELLPRTGDAGATFRIRLSAATSGATSGATPDHA